MVTQGSIARAVGVFHRVSRMLASMESLADDPSLGKIELLALQSLAGNRELTMSQLAGSVGVGLSTATKIVDRLTEKQLVERKRNGGDRRVVRVALTPRGEKTVATHEKQMNEAVARMLEALPKDEQERFIRSWEKIADAADERL